MADFSQADNMGDETVVSGESASGDSNGGPDGVRVVNGDPSWVPEVVRAP